MSAPDGPTPTHSAELVRETHYRWEQIDAPPSAPGWRRCDYGSFSEDGETYSQLWTDAPKTENPHSHNTVWVKSKRVTQERFVTPWRDVLNDGQADG